MVWHIVNNVDIDTAKKVPLFERSPFLESEGLKPSKNLPKDVINNTKSIGSIQSAENMKSPRIIKSHLPFEMLPPNLLDTCKVIFVSRNPKDTCVSFYHQGKEKKSSSKDGEEFIGTFADFADTFLDGTCSYGSYWTMLRVYFTLILI